MPKGDVYSSRRSPFDPGRARPNDSPWARVAFDTRVTAPVPISVNRFRLSPVDKFGGRAIVFGAAGTAKEDRSYGDQGR